MYMMVPTAVKPTPTHHHRSGLNGSSGLRIAFLMLGLVLVFFPGSDSRFAWLLLVACAPPVALVVGFSVCVGNICGGVYTRNMGFWGEPSNLYRFRRLIL